jgi:hypothetical protein
MEDWIFNQGHRRDVYGTVVVHVGIRLEKYQAQVPYQETINNWSTRPKTTTTTEFIGRPHRVVNHWKNTMAERFDGVVDIYQSVLESTERIRI